MTEPINDNNPIVDNVTFITFDDHTTQLENDVEDFFICRKCNKIFKNLPHYLEHKIKNENYRLVQTRSSMDRRLILPKLVQKKFIQRRKPGLAEEEHLHVPFQGSLDLVSPKQHATNDKVMAVKELTAEEPDMINSSKTSVTGPKKRGRKKKTQLNDKPIQPVIQLGANLYTCKKCEKTFRREASLRWHIIYGHDSKIKNEEDSESSEDEMDKEEHNDKDADYKVGSLVKESKDHLAKTHTDKNETNICVVIEQPSENLEEQFLNRQNEIEDTKLDVRREYQELKSDSIDRPFVCNTCGRSFKEATVLKAHGIVHSDERKYICKYDNCPYGFKTKGGLVRHERRHTGERPFVCERCNRAFSESGALARHLKARRNCSETPDSAYPRYMKSWTYHPNIPAVLDPNQRDSQKGRNTLPQSGGSLQPESSLDGNDEVHFIITDISDPKIISDGIIAPKLETILPHIVTAEILASEGDVDSKLEIKLETEGLEEWVSSKEDLDKSDEVSSLNGTAIVTAEVKEEAVVPHEHPIEMSESFEKKSMEVVMEVDPDIMELKSVIDVEQLKITQCHVCKKDFEAIEGLELHLRSHLADQPTRCGLCHFLSNDREELRQHILSLHYESLNDIEASVLSMEEDTNLTKMETMDRKAVLRNALTAVKQLYSLKKNKTMNEVEKPGLSATGTLHCMICNRLFRGNSYLRQHMRSHTGDRPYRCHQCDRSFTTRDILKKHMYVHKEQRDFKCGECGKLFKSLSHVRQHLRIHMQERSFRCSVCDKMFKTQNTLKVHLRTHSGVNPYKCQICNHCFRERGSLQRHMRLHTGEKPYKCLKCNRAFAEQGTLIRHHKAKIPCTVTLEAPNLNVNSNTNMLAQFSSVVADTQYILPEAETSQQYILPVDQEQEMTENYVILQTTGEETEVVDNFEIITEERVNSSDAAMISEEQDPGTETLEIYDSSTGESVIIVADKSVVDLVREQQRNLESEEGSCSMQKIKDILIAAGKGEDLVSTLRQESASLLAQDNVSLVEQEVSCDKSL